MQEPADFRLGGSESLPVPTTRADVWYIDDGDILCHPILPDHGFAVGPRRYIADQLLGKADDIRAIH